MSNHLRNGTVLPHGLLGSGNRSGSAAFEKSYNSYGLRMGIVTAVHPIDSDKNRSKLALEYDVIAFEQNQDRGATPITYRNCLSAEGMGSIADFLESTLRVNDKVSKKGLNTSDQNGAVVLLLCLDGMGDSAIVLKAITHPDRKTTLTDQGPRLEGEFNGVNIKIEKDGSCNLTFKGATDNDGKVIDSTQGDTVVSIEKDGTFQMKHAGVTARAEKKGKLTITAEDDISNTTKKNFNVTTTESVNVTATKDFNLKCAAIAVNASGAATMSMQKLSVKSESEVNVKGSQIQIEAESMAKIQSSQITLDGLVALGGDGGQPILLLSTQFIGIGNLGAPVLSNAISGFATKVTAT